MDGLNRNDLTIAVEDAMESELGRKNFIPMLTQRDFPALIDAVLLRFYGKPVDTAILASVVASKLCIVGV